MLYVALFHNKFISNSQCLRSRNDRSEHASRQGRPGDVPTNVCNSSTATIVYQTLYKAAVRCIISVISIAARVLKLAAKCNYCPCCCCCAHATLCFSLSVHELFQHLNTNSNHKPNTITQFELACTCPCWLAGHYLSVTAKQQHAKTQAPAHYGAHIQQLNQCRSCQTGEHAGTSDIQPKL